MKYQFVIQTGDVPFEAVVAMEDEITILLHGAAQIDGHDFGSGEANIFIITENPKANYEAIKITLGKRLEELKIKIAYRALDSSEYISLYPTEMEKFTIK